MENSLQWEVAVLRPGELNIITITVDMQPLM